MRQVVGRLDGERLGRLWIGWTEWLMVWQEWVGLVGNRVK